MEPEAEPLVMYAEVADLERIEWSWVAERLRDASSYWVVPAAEGTPHPRPVWGVFREATLFLSVGSPVLARQLTADGRVAVHLGSDTEVVVVEGRATGTSGEPDVVAAYDAKYDWTYDLGVYGDLVEVTLDKVVAWRSAGWAGRDGFQAASRFTPGHTT